jgi:hypothetical protein
MGRSKTIRVTDAAKLLELMGQLAEIKGDLAVRGAHLINELCKMLNAQVGIAGILQKNPESGSLAMIAGVEAGFLDNTSTRLLRRYIAETYSKDPMIDAMRPDARAPYTVYRAASIPDKDWYRAEFVNEVKFKMKIDDAIYCDYPLLEKNIRVGFGLNRLRGDKPFGEREKQIIDLLNTHLGWFYRQLVAEIPSERSLPPSLRRVLTELLTGASEKQIARKLRLSAYTIHDHIKKLYKHYAVSSRPELMARFIM